MGQYTQIKIKINIFIQQQWTIGGKIKANICNNIKTIKKIILRQYVQELFAENYKTLLREVKDQNKLRTL